MPESFLATWQSEPPFVDLINDADAKALRLTGRQVRFPRGTLLVHEGQVSNHVLLVEGGLVKVSAMTQGRETLLAVRGPGDLLGELSFFDSGPRSATLTAIEPVTARIFPASEFRAFLEKRPRVAIALLGLLARRLRDADRKRAEFAALDTVGRVSARLIELAERFGEPTERGIRISLPLSQEELAAWTGSSREATVKALGTLRRAGWLKTERRAFTVLDQEALRRYTL
jgi:CRP/FNR family transcriptional regulator, cyclic AMP receptor protein